MQNYKFVEFQLHTGCLIGVRLVHCCTIFLCCWDHYRNQNTNNKDHLVGSLTRVRLDWKCSPSNSNVKKAFNCSEDENFGIILGVKLTPVYIIVNLHRFSQIWGRLDSFLHFPRWWFEGFLFLTHRRHIYFWSISIPTELYDYNWHIAACTKLNWRITDNIHICGL